jgi:hypothetical protein
MKTNALDLLIQITGGALDKKPAVSKLFHRRTVTA